MKNLFALIVAAVMVAGATAPSFAAAPHNHCAFKDQSFCVAKSLSDINNS